MDAGANLSSDASGNFTSASSLNNTDPKLGPLADNGGSTKTMALLPGSPAIDGGDDVPALAQDQRGVERPQGLRSDIGAFEFVFDTPLETFQLETLPPTDLRGTMAVFHALVTPLGANPASVFFEYGTTTDYGLTTGVQLIENEANAVPMNAAVDNLQQATTYHVRVVATNRFWTVRGEDITFSTPVLPSVVTGGAYPSVNGAMLTGKVSPNANASVAWFEYGLTANLGSLSAPLALAGGTDFLPVAIELAAPLTAPIYYRLVATNEFGTNFGGSYFWTPGSVSTAEDNALRGNVARGGAFRLSFNGTLVLTNTLVVTRDLVLDGEGHQVILNGNNAFRVFEVSSNVSLTLKNMTIANGLHTATNTSAAPGGGGGILNMGGTVTLANVVLSNNIVMGGAGANGRFGAGGAIYNAAGTLTLRDCICISNLALFYPIQDWGSYESSGGSIYNDHGSIEARESIFAFNQAIGGAGNSKDCNGYGGAIGSSTGLLCFIDCNFLQNQVKGGNTLAGDAGGAAEGGALYLNGGSLAVTNCLFATNITSGGNASQGSVGWYSDAGSGIGGGICNGGGNITVVNSTFSGNRARSGEAGIYGISAGGGICNEEGTTTLINVTLNGNDLGTWFGSWNYAGGSLCVSSGEIRLKNTIVANGLPFNTSGAVIDNGNNLQWGDQTCGASVPLADPKLGPLADNGGPTLTHALLTDSPAIDAGADTGAPLTDQRGVSRPQGAHTDIGAFELVVQVGIRLQANGTLAMQFVMPPNQICVLQDSSDLKVWTDLDMAMSGDDGVVSFEVPNTPSLRFFRAKKP